MSSALLSSGVSPFVAGSFSRPLKGLTPTVVSCTISCTHPPWRILLAIMMIPWSLNSDKLQQLLFLFIIKALLNITIIAVLTKSHKFTHPERRRGRRRKLLTPTTPNTNNRSNPTEIQNPQNSNNKNTHKITSTANHNTKSTNQTTTKTNDDKRERENICFTCGKYIHTMWQQEHPFFVIKLISSLQWKTVTVPLQWICSCVAKWQVHV